ncbi:putative thiamine biosynthesis protein [Anaerotignum neopropionicum]|uniref:Putative thiamine biosynthesis protein n=1 Tax=Anaerotignum neopropionicum TaxID=36847 RepID=A0A136WHW1_9FIRM|nr:ABC transporter substrate-binding protein [Anaerotignum neopropionicum]KXL54067.1 putative thiamine biosynthesis protein [Anaerotignum neopropionicum]
MKKRLFAFLMTAIMAVGTVGCTSSSKNADGNTGDINENGQQKLEDFSIVLDWYPNAIHSFLYTGIEKGYFAEEGLNLVINFPSNVNDGISLPAAGKADLGIYYLQDAILTATEENVPIVSVGALTQSSLNVVVALKDSGIDGAEDLKGKKIGYSGTVLSEEQIKSMLKYVGLSADDCQFIDVGFDLLTAVTTGQVDATIGNMVNHEVPQLEENGFEINYFYPTDFGVPQQYELVLLAGKNAVENNPEKIQKFLRACQKSYADMKANPDESLQVLLDNQNEENFPLSKTVEQKSMEILLPVMETADAPFLHQEVSVWQENADWLYDRGILSEKTDVSNLIVNLVD